MSLSAEVTRAIEQLRQDRKHGASWISQQAIKVICLSLKKTAAKDVAALREEIKTVGKQLTQSRPTMTAIANNVSYLVCQILKESEQDQSLATLKSSARSICDNLIKHTEKAALQAAEHGAEVVADQDQLMTCSYSSTVCTTLKIARQQGKQFHVVVAKSKSRCGMAYGEITAAQIKAQGIAVESIPDDDIPHHMSRMNKVMVGADSVLGDGTLINGTPTYRVALAAKNANVPFYCVCETSKISAPAHCDEGTDLEEGFDRISPSLITGVITEEGMTRPTRTQI